MTCSGRLVLIAACVVGAAAFLPAQAQTPSPSPPPGPDLALAELEVGPVPAWTYGDPGSTMVRANVANVGRFASAYRIEYSWIPDGGAAVPLNGDAQTSFDVGEPLAPRESREHHATWTLTSGVVGSGRVVAVVTPASASDRAPGDNQRANATFVAIHALRLSDLANGTMEIPPESTRFLRVRLDNDGNEAARVQTRVVRADPSDERLVLAMEPALIEVPPQGHAEATLYARYEPAGDLASFSSRVEVEADPGFGEPLRTWTGPLSDLPAWQASGYAFDLLSNGTATIHARADADAWSTLRLINLGTQPDDYTLGAALPLGWQATFDPPRIALDAGAAADVHLALRASADDLPGTPVTIAVSAASGAVGLRQDLDLHARRSGPGLVVDAMELPTMYAGDEPTLDFGLSNAGDAPVANSTLALRILRPGAPPQALPPVPTPGVAADIRAVVKVKLPALAGGPLAIEATWIAPNGMHQPGPAAAEALVRSPEASVEAPPGRTGVPGEAVAYRVGFATFSVTNRGSSEEEFELEVTTDRGTAILEGPTRLTLSPGEHRGVPLVHTLPMPSGRAADANVTLHAKLVVRPLSWSATVATSIQDVQPPAVTIEAPARSAIGARIDVVVAAMDDARVAVVVLNATSPSGAVLPLALKLENGTWQAVWSAESAGVHRLRVLATDAAGNKGRAQVDVEVVASAGPELRPAGPMFLVRSDSQLVFDVTTFGVAVQSAEATLEQGGIVKPLNLTLHGGKVNVKLAAAEGSARLKVAVVDGLGLSANVTVDLFIDNDAPVPNVQRGSGKDAGAAPAGLAAAALALTAWRRRR